MLFKSNPPELSGLRLAIANAYRMDEAASLKHLLQQAELDAATIVNIQRQATKFVEKIRKNRDIGGIDSFLHEYQLTSDEGIALMCLAESFLRVPDKATIDKLIRDKLLTSDWRKHLGRSNSMFVNAATWGLLLTGKLLSPEQQTTQQRKVVSGLKKFVSRSSEPVIRKSVKRAMAIMSKQFVMGRNIKDAVTRARILEAKGFRYSYDMLGEAALTQADAERYFDAYTQAIKAVGRAAAGMGDIAGPGVSVKLSALFPRYEFAQRERAIESLSDKLLQLALIAKQNNIALTVDAEEAERLDLSLDIIETVFTNPQLNGWEGLGVAVQSYQKRAWYVLNWLAALAKSQGQRIKVRLIKGAYWDSEIKLSQMEGLSGYPVFTRKVATDVSFQACAKKLIANKQYLYPQFATHNAYSVALVMELMGDSNDYEFQCLHGMGQALYQQIVPRGKSNIPCRIYAPVGVHEDLLPYLVRRLLENGANSSFVNRIVDETAPIAELVADPVAELNKLISKSHPNIPLPKDIFMPQRANSRGMDLTDWQSILPLDEELMHASKQQWQVAPIINGKENLTKGEARFAPWDNTKQIGFVRDATSADIEAALSSATAAFQAWSGTDVNKRARILENIAKLFEQHRSELMALAIHEAGKTVADALAEVREAVDFCYYYATQARQVLAEPQQLAGYTGEDNSLQLHGRGSMLCISPWNFPLAIFTGQVVACLVTGNPVIAKPAEQTPLIAGLAVRLMHAAGVPAKVLHLLPGDGETVGAECVADPRIKGVLFTGSTQTARIINQTLATRDGPIVPLIAETGGQNAMIVDSSALHEQVVADVIQSSFGSAGQRCSACRVIYVQRDIEQDLLTMLKGAMAELQIGDPRLLETDVGPVIDKEAKRSLDAHIENMQQLAKENQAELLYATDLNNACNNGTYVAPHAFKISSINVLQQENFGPILHVISFAANELDKVIEEINSTGYGLTLGIHSRIETTVEKLQREVHAGNCYVNRNMIGAVVGLQPFGGEGLSGTGPKAGGPHYLLRLCNERTLTVNTTAAGGNASLFAQAGGV